MVKTTNYYHKRLLFVKNGGAIQHRPWLVLAFSEDVVGGFVFFVVGKSCFGFVLGNKMKLA